MTARDPEQLLSFLRERVLRTLGVRDQAELLEQAVDRACEELEVIETALEREDITFSISSACHYAVQGVRARLDLARELAAGEYE